jgi:DnaJ-class molecular chaperone
MTSGVSSHQFQTPVPPKKPHRCPICGGTGTVPADFYSQLGSATSTARAKCRACNGRGIVIA